ncbi:MAG TPA: ADP-glyceromanno-heptose 6-epimerase [Candidatus Brocadiia bacterium]|nr:ADP-glyceromanno-heptose 6-epimerase [Candidatus Brocadiia bacterium]
MYIVTGAAGFIGGNIVKRLNGMGVTNILAVDDLAQAGKFLNLRDAVIADYMSVGEFRERLDTGRGLPAAKAVLHQGAWADTMAVDGPRMMEMNFTFSKLLLRYALERRVPFVYASSCAVYGASADFAPLPCNERPLNLYGWSKLVFDQHVRALAGPAESTVVGLRYANVYGPGERHKGRMASMPYQMHRQLAERGVARLFAGSGGYGDGEQRRDFVFVEDVVSVNLFFVESPARRAVVNVGSGVDRSFNDVARILIALRGGGRVEYIPFPDALRGRYQNRTRADLAPLRQAGYVEPMTSLEQGLAASAPAWDLESVQ